MCVPSIAQEETNNKEENTPVEKTAGEQKQPEESVASEDGKSTEDAKEKKSAEDTESEKKSTEEKKSAEEKSSEDEKSKDDKAAKDGKAAEGVKSEDKEAKPEKESSPDAKPEDEKENSTKTGEENANNDAASEKKDNEKTEDKSADTKDSKNQQPEKDNDTKQNANNGENVAKESVKELLTTLATKVESLEKLEKIWEESSKSEEDLYAIANFLSLVDAPNKKIIRHMITLTKSKYEKVRKVSLDRLLEIMPTLMKIKAIDNTPSDEDFVNILSSFDSDMSVAAMLMEYSKEEKVLNALILKSLMNMGTKSLEGIIRFLRISPSEKIKNVAINVSYGVGVDCIPMIIPLLGDLNPFIQDFAKRALKKFDEKTLPSLKKYIQTAANKENIALAIAVIGDMGEKAKGTVPILVKYLKKEGPTQLAATRALKNMGMHAYVALDHFISNLRSDDWQVRQASAETIGNFGEKAKKAVTPLMSQFRREDYGIVRASICRQFGRIGKPAKSAIRTLIEALNDEDEIVIKSAAESLGDFGKSAEKAIEPLTKVLIYYDVKEREAAAKALAKIGRRSVSVLMNMLNYHEDPAGREGAAMALGYMGSQARRSVRALTKALKFDEAEIVKIAAADALGKIGDRYAIHALIDAVRNGTVVIREVATSSLIKIGSAAVIDITRALKRPGTEARIALVYILGELGRNAIPAVGTLNSCLDSWRGKEREQLIKTLGKIGPNKRSTGTLNRFVELMKKTRDDNERQLLAESLKLFGDMSIPFVIPLLKSDSEEIVSQTKNVIGHLIKEAFSTLEKIVEKGDDEVLTSRSIEILSKDAKSLPIILKKFKHESSLVRNTAKDSVVKNIGEKAVPGLISILQNTALSIERKVVGDTLAGIGKSAVDSLVLVISNSDKQKARLAAIDAVSQIGPKARGAIPVLQESIKIRRGGEQTALARCLGSIGTQAIPKILELLEHNDSSVQNAAVDALGETGAKDSISHLLSSLENERLLSLVIKAMVKMPDLAVPTLIRSLQHQNRTVRFACAAALFEIAPAKSIAPLAQRILVENDPMVKYMLQTALNRCQNLLENNKSSD
ncbi:HEAT repeat-containing PBS lyase [Candidatus Uabimicrobium amorphum]|uniref:HEAT repeat-containing PBS lyase n=2 Tax=Uabimicrobium amorphum TaxID=2596890 RepID=A0A5S9IKF8_UABAM|nr:HEAT repeat-containing PBS lyase [Candidatus Uabimicrobium amorphum]